MKNTASSKQKTAKNRLVRRGPSPLALEQRFMFDGAAVSDAIDTAATANTPVDSLLNFAAADTALPTAVISARADAEKLVADYLSQPDAQDKLFALFNGGRNAPSDQWQSAFKQLLADLQTGGDAVRVELRSGVELQGAKGAFSTTGTTGQYTIYLNSDWLAGNPEAGIGPADSASIETVLVEELGHSLDVRLNGSADTAGDEGQHFSDVLLNGADPYAFDASATQDDHGTVAIDGQSVDVEFASFTFSNAYEMVYDQNNDTVINTTERWADKEQNLHYFDTTRPLGQVQITDGANGVNFSGNDVSATSIIVGGNTYYGWISRPIKSGGVVRGFYFWTDNDFNNQGSAAANFAAAQADGNQDGDSNVMDNRGFLLVVDQTWFTSQIAATKVSKGINNAKDGNLGTIDVSNVGSSSDRVDSALNSLIVPNSTPIAANDSLTINEDSGTATVSAANGLLKNDSDVNNDSLTVTTFSVGGIDTTVDPTTGGTYTIANVGSITINKDGSYSFTPVANYNGPVPPITYTVSDGHGGTATAVLSISVTPVNDAPAGTDDSITTSENTPKVLSLDDFGTYSDPENDPLAKIQITQLATNGTLQYWNGATWAAVTTNQELTVTQILQGQVRFAPDAGESGSNYATVQFKVSDGQAYSASAYTLTVNVMAGNQAPVANADTNAVAEEGCAVAAVNATGNVLTDGTDDSDPESQTLTVSAVTFDGYTKAVAGATTIKGLYGTLTIYTDGSYSYALDNTLAAIDAMKSGDTKTDIFSYSVTDGENSDSTTLTLTINGTNDAPIGTDDFNSFEEGTNQSAGNYGTVTVTTNGVLANDTDVDNTNGELTVKLIDGTTPPSGTLSTIATFSVSTPITSVTVAATTVTGYDSPPSVLPGTALTAAAFEVSSDNGGTWTTAKELDGGNLTVYYVSSGGGAYYFSDNVALYGYQTAIFRYVQTSPLKEARWTVALSNPVNSGGDKIYTASTGINDIQVGDVVSWSGSSGTIKVTGINTSTGEITIDNDNDPATAYSATLQNASLTFQRSTGGVTISSTQEYFQGSDGYLILNQNGSYTYTLTTNLGSDQVVNESFTYHVVDPANGCTGSATINIRAYGVDAPTLVNDTLVVNEDTGVHVAFNGAVSGSDSVKANDLDGTAAQGGSGITLGDVTSFKVAGDTTVYSAGQTATITDIGTLSIAADGTIVFDPVDGYLGSVPTVTYTRTGSDNKPYTATLSISIQAVDNQSVLASDTNSVAEDTTATGNVLANDTDVDSTLTVASFTVNSVTTTLSGGAGSYLITGVGTLTLNSNGNYTFVPVANWNGSVPQITYTTNTGSSSTLGITVTPVNDPPTLDLDGDNSSTATGNDFKQSYTNAGTPASIGDADVAIADVDDVNIESAVIVLANPQSGDALTVGTLPSGIVASGPTSSGGVITITLSGPSTLANYQAAIQAITFSSTGNATMDRVVSVKVNDGNTDSNTAYTTITVGPDARLLTVTGTTVNEASPYVQFQVGGVAGQWVNLTLSETANGSGNATMGTDFLPNLQYFNGTSWVDYTGGAVQIPSGSSTLLVRTPVLQDQPYEGAETLKLTATNQAGTAATANSTIIDDGTGSVYLGNNTTSTPNNPNDTDPNGPDYPAKLDDDRPVTVDSIVVNEASPWAMFTVSGYAGQEISLALHNGTATAGDGNPADGSEDYGTGLEYWNGSAWTAYSTSVTLSGSTLLVRTAIHQDTLFEGQHSFSLGVTKLSSGTTVYGSADIYDDGTGNKYEFDDINDGTVTITSGPGAGFDDDRTLTVDSPVVNEGSDYVVFTLTGNSGQTASLALVEETGIGKANIVETQTLKIWDGLTWVDYDANNLPTFDANGKVFVRVDIIAEQDTPYEGGETFKLDATLTGQSSVVTGTATIMDDGTGVIYDGTITSGSPATNTTNLDNDLNTLPVASNDSATFTPGTPTTVDVVANDTTGDTVVAATVVFTSGSATNSGKTLVVAGEGTWSINATTGAITFTPLAGFVANPTAVMYKVADAQGNFATASVTLTNGTADLVTAKTLFSSDATPNVGDTVTFLITVTNNGSATATNVHLTDQLPSGLTYTANTASAGSYNSSTGVWTIGSLANGASATLRLSATVNAAADGTNLTNTTGQATSDQTDPTDSGNDLTETVVVDKLPVASNDSATFTPGTPTTVDVVANDTTGDTVVAATVVFTSGSATNSGKTLVVAGEGTWSINATTGAITFTPLAGFVANPTAVMYKVADAQGNFATASVTLTKVDDTPVPLLPVPPLAPIAPPLAPIVPPEILIPSAESGEAPQTGLLPFDSAITSPLNPFAPPSQGNSITSSVQDIPLRDSNYQDSIIADIYTSPTGFRVAVIEAPQASLTLYRGMADQYVDTGSATAFAVPYDAFAHTDPNQKIMLSAMLSDGGKLPEWVVFDAQSGKFTVLPPKNFIGELKIKVTARDSQGREVSTLFRFSVGEKHSGAAVGRQGFSEQLRFAGQRQPMKFVTLNAGHETDRIQRSAVKVA